VFSFEVADRPRCKTGKDSDLVAADYLILFQGVNEPDKAILTKTRAKVALNFNERNFSLKRLPHHGRTKAAL
jgi:hypothetical protein